MSVIKKQLLIIAVCVLVSGFSFGQIRLYYDKFDFEVLPTMPIDSITVKISKGEFKNNFATFNFKNYGGESTVQLHDSKGRLICIGQFQEGKDTLIKYVYGKVLGKGKDNVVTKVKKIKYLIPLPIGIWIFYKNGHEIGRTNYDYVW